MKITKENLLTYIKNSTFNWCDDLIKKIPTLKDEMSLNQDENGEIIWGHEIEELIPFEEDGSIFHEEFWGEKSEKPVNAGSLLIVCSRQKYGDISDIDDIGYVEYNELVIEDYAKYLSKECLYAYCISHKISHMIDEERWDFEDNYDDLLSILDDKYHFFEFYKKNLISYISEKDETFDFEKFLECAFHPYCEDDEEWLNINHYSKCFFDCRNEDEGEFHTVCEFTL